MKKKEINTAERLTDFRFWALWLAGLFLIVVWGHYVLNAF
jgi:hypothetical protein